VTTYTVLLVDGDNSGATVATLSTGSGAQDAQIDSLTWTLNDHDAASIRVPVGHASIGSIVEMSINSEVRIERDGSTVFWGVITRSQLGTEFLHLTVQGLTFYFERRHVGDQDRTNLVTNGDFETVSGSPSVPTGWSEADPGSDIVLVSSTQYHKTGSRSARILSRDRAVDLRANSDPIASPTSPDDYHGIDAQVIQNVGPLFVGENFFHVVVCKAWFFIRDDGTYAFQGKPFDGRGFYVQTLSSGTWTGRHWFYRIDEQTERNVWIRAEFEVLVYGGETVQIRLYAPGGTAGTNSAIYWDSVGMFLEESLSFYGSGGTGTDVVNIVEGLIEHAQGLTVLGQPGPSNKDDLNIRGDPANSTVGTTFTVAYQHADHGNIGEAVKAYTDVENGVDIRVTWNGTNTARYVRVGRPIGSAKATYNLQISGASSNVIDIANYLRDGQPVANSIVVLGDGSGPDREEAAAIDTTGLGVAWEAVLRAPPSWDIDQLDEFAAGELESRKNIVETFTVRLTDDDFAAPIAGNLLVGDTVQVSGQWGNINWTNKVMRLIRLTLQPSTGVYTAEFNPS